MLIYELPASSLKCRAQPNVIRRSFEPHDQMLYHRTILEPHTAYTIPAGKNYIVLTVQKTAFGLDIIPESLLSLLIQKGFHVGDFRKMKKFDQTPYRLPPPTPTHVRAKSDLWKKNLYPRNDVPCPKATCADSSVTSPTVQIPVSQVPQSPVQIPDVPEHVQIPVSQVPRPPMQILQVPESPVQILHVLEPVQIPVSQVPQSPVQIPLVPETPVQILPELDTLDPLESTDAFDQLMSFIFGPQ
ncbi:uncharacterized protein TNCV_1922821 [Trichonephila clavipes]|nr:uncharacterized protein TNCV_1922821 [Trichonephila clavipes]